MEYYFQHHSCTVAVSNECYDIVFIIFYTYINSFLYTLCYIYLFMYRILTVWRLKSLNVKLYIIRISGLFIHINPIIKYRLIDLSAIVRTAPSFMYTIWNLWDHEMGKTVVSKMFPYNIGFFVVVAPSFFLFFRRWNYINRTYKTENTDHMKFSITHLYLCINKCEFRLIIITIHISLFYL